MSLEWTPLLLVALLEAGLLVAAWRRVRGSPAAELSALGELLIHDLAERAEVGELPDWRRYREEVELIWSGIDERLRSLAAAALATGLGGTILALLVHLRAGTSPGGEGASPLGLVQATASSLSGSLAGVAVHLMIVLVLLPKAEAQGQAAWRELAAKLREIARRRPPKREVLAALEAQLGVVEEAIRGQFAAAFEQAAARLPGVIDQLSNEVGRLSTSVEEQLGKVGDVAMALGSSAVQVSRASARLEPAATSLAASTAEMVHLPEAMARALSDARESWTATLSAQHERALAELSGAVERAGALAAQRERELVVAVREIQDGVVEVKAALRSLSSDLGESIAMAARGLGTEFGREAREHTLDLARTVRDDHAQLLAELAKRELLWREDFAHAARTVLDRVGEEVESRFLARFEAASRQLGELAERLPTSAASFAEAHQDWTRAQVQTLSGWQEAATATSRAAERLAEADGRLGAATATLSHTSTHLDRLATGADGLPAAIARAVGEAATPLLGEIARERQRLDGLLVQQAEVIRRCLLTLARDGA